MPFGRDQFIYYVSERQPNWLTEETFYLVFLFLIINYFLAEVTVRGEFLGSFSSFVIN